ncbi:MAG: NAD(P)-dependent oxidoreductase [Chloroflexaceae bacterium]|nr:NAD(P)-dependent oxidoreductase [Chloroflexaceae bacterium]
MNKRVLIVGATGCIGHYLVEALAREPEYELFLLVRNPEKLCPSVSSPSMHLIPGDLRNINRYRNFLKTIHVAILAAAAWGGAEETYTINVTKTIELIRLLNEDMCEQIIYFSTASILDRTNQLLPEAKDLGTDYIRSKYEAFEKLTQLPIAPKITALFPTLVFGGDGNKPYSHLSAGLPEIVRWIDLIRWFKADGSFHFIHARDIAQIVRRLVMHPPMMSKAIAEPIPHRFVLGNPRLTVNETIENACEYLQKRIYFRIKLSPWLTNFFIRIFRIYMDDWSRFSLKYRHFTYLHPVNPRTFGSVGYCATLADIFKDAGILPK